MPDAIQIDEIVGSLVCHNVGLPQGLNTGAEHQPVLLSEALDGLGIEADGCYVDATYGRGGHSTEILDRLGGQGRLLAMDKDRDAVEAGHRRFGGDSRFSIVHAGFEDFAAIVRPWLGSSRLRGVLFDIGVSSPQLETAERGFSFTREGPLDMRMDTTTGPSATEWLARVEVDDLTSVLRRYGEEPNARRIAVAIAKARVESPITTTTRLAAIVASVARGPKKRTHPATQVFQAIRIAVNGELDALEKGLGECIDVLAPGGRVAVISFHSLEDRIVKRRFAREVRGDPRYAGLPVMPVQARPRLRNLGRLIRPSEAEAKRNPRARSARLRVAERLPSGVAS